MEKLGIYIDGEKTNLDQKTVKLRIEQGYYDGHSVKLYTGKKMSDLMACRILEMIKTNPKNKVK